MRSQFPGSEGWEVAEFSGYLEGDGKAWVEETLVTHVKSQDCHERFPAMNH